ncbi:MAG: lytic transglycosylase domain-containing protein [Candidatus Solibacter sp.]|nr:lytic transglycosylase domain-containing protein [Candidatus Solibacter sp.]
MTLFLYALFAGAALAQTAAPPPAADKAAVVPPGADKAPAPAPAKPAETFQSAMEKQRAAMAIQRESVRKQIEMAVQWHAQSPPMSPGIEAPGDADCPPIGDVELTPLIDRAAQQHQVDTKLLRGVIEQESAFRPCAISAKGAKGLMQLMPATIEQFNVGDVFDPQQNIEAGATFLKQLLDKYKGDLKLVLAAYNAGPANVDKIGGIPDIKETQDYVESIIKKIR